MRARRVSVGALPTASASTNGLSFKPDGSAVSPEAFLQHIALDPKLIAKLYQSDPEMAKAVKEKDLKELKYLLQDRREYFCHCRSVFRFQRLRECISKRSVFRCPLDVKAKGIEEKCGAASGHNPFDRVVVLYVQMSVNAHTLKALVHSATQSTIMSKHCAERCGLLRHLDESYKGIAHGVGQSEILGLIHSAPIKINGKIFECSFLVLDSPNIDVLFGLDMLHKHQCVIDFKEKVLRLGDEEVSVSFSREKDIPSRFLDEGGHAKQTSILRTAGTPEATDEKSTNVAHWSSSVVGTLSTSDLWLDPIVDPGAFLQHILHDSGLMPQLFEIPQLAEFVLGNGENLHDCLKNLRCQCRHCTFLLQCQQDWELALRYSNPFDLQAQKNIEAAIRQKRSNERSGASLQHNSEAFARVVMPHVGMGVNGHTLKALVDSAAQSTIISKRLAEACGLMICLEPCFEGIGHGVLGRFRLSLIKIGAKYYHCPLIVVDSPDVEFVFGLDMLLKHQFTVDLKNDVLEVGDGEKPVPFLEEKVIPWHKGQTKRAKLEYMLDWSYEAELEAKVEEFVTQGGIGRERATLAIKKFNLDDNAALNYLVGGPQEII